ncbi:MAG: hypothetical protein IKD69_06265, partial [Solobacterium sp.]|nr:hypothetical protein [Solobacterium sp.]
AAEEPSDEEEVSVQNEGFDAASASFDQSSEAFLDLQDDEPKEEYVPQLTLDPNHESDDAFMKEMEEFLKN